MQQSRCYPIKGQKSLVMSKACVMIHLKFMLSQLKLKLFSMGPAPPIGKNGPNMVKSRLDVPSMKSISIPFTWHQKSPPTVSFAGPYILQIQSGGQNCPTHGCCQSCQAMPDVLVVASCWCAFKDHCLSLDHKGNVKPMPKHFCTWISCATTLPLD